MFYVNDKHVVGVTKGYDLEEDALQVEVKLNNNGSNTFDLRKMKFFLVATELVNVSLPELPP